MKPKCSDQNGLLVVVSWLRVRAATALWAVVFAMGPRGVPAEVEGGLDPVIYDQVVATLALPIGASVGPSELARMQELSLCCRNLREIRLPPGMTNLRRLLLQSNRLSEVNLPPDLESLEVLDLTANQIGSLSIPPATRRLERCYLNRNVMTNLVLPGGLWQLEHLGVSENRLQFLRIPSGYTGLRELMLNHNRLERLDLGDGLTNLVRLNLTSNFGLRDVAFLEGLSGLRALELSLTRIPEFRIPAGLTNLESVGLQFSLISRLTVPPGLIRLQRLDLEAAQVIQLVVPEGSGGVLTPGAAEMQAAGVELHYYPPVVRLEIGDDPRSGTLWLRMAGPPGRYGVLQSMDLERWHRFDVVTNDLGNAAFKVSDVSSAQVRFYRLVAEP